MTPLFTPLSEAGRPDKNAGTIIALDGEGALCTFKGKNLDRIPFEDVSSPIGVPSFLGDAIGEFVAEPQGLCLSFVVAYSLAILFPTILVQELQEKNYQGEDLLGLSQEAFFKEILSPYFSEAMVESFADEGSLSFATLQARMKKNSFSNEYLVHLNDLTSLRLGIRFSNLRFGVADRSSISLKTAVKRGRKVAEKAGR
jgi:hypothetical protein